MAIYGCSMEIKQVTLKTNNIDEMKRFYNKTLGLTLIKVVPLKKLFSLVLTYHRRDCEKMYLKGQNI